MSAIPSYFFDILYRQQVALIVVSTFLGASLIDFLTCLPAEVKFIYVPELKKLRRGRLPTLPSFLLFFARLVIIPVIALAFSSYLSRAKHCNALWRILLTLYALCSINASSIFIVRAIAIRNSRRPMIAFLTFLLLGQSAVLFLWVSQAQTRQLSFNSPYVGNCFAVTLPGWTYKLFLELACFDLLIMCITLHDSDMQRTWQNLKTTWRVWNSSSSSITETFYSITIFYHAVSLAFLFSEVAWTYIYHYDELYIILTAPVHIMVVLNVAPKAIRSLKIHNAKQMAQVKNHMAHSQTSSHQNQRFNDVAVKENHISSQADIMYAPTLLRTEKKVRRPKTAPSRLAGDHYRRREVLEAGFIEMQSVHSDNTAQGAWPESGDSKSKGNLYGDNAA